MNPWRPDDLADDGASPLFDGAPIVGEDLVYLGPALNADCLILDVLASVGLTREILEPER